MDPFSIYREAGLFAQAEPLPFVGSASFLAGSSPDSTRMLVSVSLANRALTFVTDSLGHKAAYSVLIDVRRGGASEHRLESQDTVRVASFRETMRGDESVIFQRFVTLPPGSYAAHISVRDLGSPRISSSARAIEVPRFDARSLSSAIAIYQASPRESRDSLPEIIASPRATVAFGRDSIVQLYVEGYNLETAARIAIQANTEAGTVLRDTLTLLRHGDIESGVINLPVARLGPGQSTIQLSLVGSADTLNTPVFVSFSDDWAIMSVDDMLSYLRYYVLPERIRALRDTIPENRAAAWAEFLSSTDPIPSTPEHEGLRDYFARLQVANTRFREDGAEGWLTDRGRVYITLGEPDQVLEQTEVAFGQRGRAQSWMYQQYRIQLVFVDQTGFGRWRLTPSSEQDFHTVARRDRMR